jgi:hypothetical protein
VSSIQQLPRKVKVSLLVGGLVFVGVCVFGYIEFIRPPKVVNLAGLGNKHEVEEDPDRVHLSAVAAPAAIRDHLLDADFRVVYRMQDISEDCISIFDSSFLNNSRTVPKKEEIRFADPGQPAQYGDSLIPDAPFRQLVFAGQGPRTCFVYYEHGGENHPSYCLALMDQADRKTMWVGEVRKKAESLVELRSFLSENQFDDTVGPGC